MFMGVSLMVRLVSPRNSCKACSMLACRVLRKGSEPHASSIERTHTAAATASSSSKDMLSTVAQYRWRRCTAWRAGLSLRELPWQQTMQENIHVNGPL